MRNQQPSEFIRNCPTCPTILYYKTKSNLTGANKKNTRCEKCKFANRTHPWVGRTHSQETKQLLSEQRAGISWQGKFGEERAEELKQQMSERMKIVARRPKSAEVRKNMSDAKKGEKSVWYGKKHTLETREKMSSNHSGENSYWYGKTFSADHKEKLRTVRLRQVRNTMGVYYNPVACEYFSHLEAKNGWNGYYATKNEEYEVAGYSVDYFEPALNIVIEYDEPHHYTIRGLLKAKDRRRQQIITERLDCKFFRYNEITGELNEY